MAWKPIVMKNADLVLGEEASGTDFAIQLTSITLTPDVAVERLKTLKPTGRYSSVDEPEWTLELGYAVGEGSSAADEALADFLLDHNGEQMPFTFRPRSGGAGYTGTTTAVAGAFGGDQGAFASQSVSLPVEGQPERVTASTAG